MLLIHNVSLCFNHTGVTMVNQNPIRNGEKFGESSYPGKISEQLQRKATTPLLFIIIDIRRTDIQIEAKIIILLFSDNFRRFSVDLHRLGPHGQSSVSRLATRSHIISTYVGLIFY